MKKKFVLLFLLTSTITMAQNKIDFVTYIDTVFKFKFQYPNNYILKYPNKDISKESYNNFLLFRLKTNDSLKWNFKIIIQRRWDYNNGKGRESFMDFVINNSQKMYDAGYMSWGDTIKSLKNLKTKSQIDFVEVYEKVCCKITKDLKDKRVSKSIQGPTFYIDLSPTTNDKVITFVLCSQNYCKTQLDKENERALRQILDSFEFIN